MIDHPFPEQTKVEKINSEPGDVHPDGARGRIVLLAYPAPITPPADDPIARQGPQWLYFVEWEANKGLPVMTVGRKLRPA